jgi:hypothetical protein
MRQRQERPINRERTKKDTGGGKRRVTRRVATSANGFKIGREDFAAISAVEGLDLSDEMRREFRQFDAEGLSASERRKWIIAKYGR